MQIYVRMREGNVAYSSCVNAAMTLDYDDNDGLLGIEVLGAIGLEIDGVRVGRTWLDLARIVSEIAP
jgi:hypothetical protein